MSIAAKFQSVIAMFEAGMITKDEAINILNWDAYYGPSFELNGNSFYLINNEYLNEDQYKDLVFDKDMKDLLK